MRAEAFVLPELFARPRVQFVCAPQQARTAAARAWLLCEQHGPGLRLFA